VLIRLRRNPHVVHACGGARVVYAVDAAEDASPRNRDHHDAGCIRFAVPVRRRLAERVTKEELL